MYKTIEEDFGLVNCLNWLNNLAIIEKRKANLARANLDGANLARANLKGANLDGANLDFSVLNLSCKGIGLNFDERVIKQIMNHALKQNNHCEVYEEIKQAFLSNPKWLEWLESWGRQDEVAHLREFKEARYA